MVRIAHHNLALDEPQTIVPDAVVVFCRNVLMYFGREESEACIQRIASHIAPGGHLFLGHSDSPGRMSTYFAAVRVAGALCHERLSAAPPAAQIGTRLGATTPPRDMTGLLTQGKPAAAGGDLRAHVRASRH